MEEFIPVNEPLLNGNEKKYLLECIDSGWISSEGPYVEQFEKDFSASVGRKYGIAVTNGTSAVDIAVEVLGVGSGDEVILPSFTIISCVNQIIRSGATPVLIDSHPLTWNMDVEQIERNITSKTKAIMVVHIYGLPVEMTPVLQLAKQYNLKVIEDAAEMHGQEYRGKLCGSFGDISTFSFYPNKHITTGEGGMLVTDDENLANECRSLRNLCFQSNKRFVHERLGWNFRMTNVQAAIGVAQLEQLDKFVEKKRAMGAYYTEFLEDLDSLQLPLERTDYADNIYWVFGLVLTDDFPLDAEEVMKRLAKGGIGSRPFFCPMHMQPVLKKMGLYKDTKLPVSERMYQQGFYIPSGLSLTKQKMDRVIEVLREVVST